MKRGFMLIAPVVIAVLLAGCASKTSPEPTVTTTTVTTAPAPTATAPSDPVQTSRAEVQQAYVRYSDVANEVYQDGFKDWDTKLLPLTTGEAATALTDDATLFGGLGYRAVGNIVVTNVRVDEYNDTDPEGHYNAKLTVCVNTTGVKLVADGKEDVPLTPNGRFYSTIIMQRWLPVWDDDVNISPDPQGQGWWRVQSKNIDPERPC